MFTFWKSTFSDEQSEINDLYLCGKKLLSDGQFFDAIKMFKICLKQQPENITYQKSTLEAYHKFVNQIQSEKKHLTSVVNEANFIKHIIQYYEAMHSIAPSSIATHHKLSDLRFKHYQMCKGTTPEAIFPQSPLPITNLVFQGGGIRGIAYKGAYEELAENFVDVRGLQRIGGTSAGAISALPIALGYHHSELDPLIDIDFSTFFDGDCSADFLALINEQEKMESITENILEKGKHVSIRSISSNASAVSGKISTSLRQLNIGSLIKLFKAANSEKLGLFKGDFFREQWAEKIIQQQTNIPYLTFKELHELHMENPEVYKDLYMIGVNLNTGKAIVMSYETTPDAIISDAIRISISIPAVFEPHHLHMKDKHGQRVLFDTNNCQNITPYDLFVDGGVLMNYPLTLFDKKKYLPGHEKSNDTSGIENPHTLGFRLIDTSQKDHIKSPDNLVELLTRIAKIGVTLLQRDDCLDQANRRTIYINHLGIPSVMFDLKNTVKEALCNNGKHAVREQLPKLEIYDNRSKSMTI